MPVFCIAVGPEISCSVCVKRGGDIDINASTMAHWQEVRGEITLKYASPIQKCVITSNDGDVLPFDINHTNFVVIPKGYVVKVEPGGGFFVLKVARF